MLPQLPRFRCPGRSIRPNGRGAPTTTNYRASIESCRTVKTEKPVLGGDRPMFTLPSKDDLKLLRMRNAFRSSEAISALLAAAVLWPLTHIVVFGVVLTVNTLRTGNLRAVLISLLFVTTIALVGLALWLALDWFFYSAGCLVSVVSLLLFVLFIYLSGQATAKLTTLAQPNRGDIRITFAIAFSLATAFFFYWHGMRIGLLEREERSVVAKHWPGQTVTRRFFGNLLVWRHATGRSLSTIAVTLLLTIAKMVQGLSVYVLFFVFGVVLFNGTMFSVMAFYSIYDRSRVGSPDGLFPMVGLIIAFFGITLAAAFLLTQGAMALKRSARWLSRYSFEQTVANDQRPPILFLRSFTDDQVTLPTPPLYVTYWLAEPKPRRLDHALVERFGNLAPIVAIGKPGEKDLPFGASRLYVKDSDWQAVVKDLAMRAHGVVVIADVSDGVAWEIQCMLQEPFVEKSIFLASPRLGTQGLEAHPLVGPVVSANVKLSKGFRILAAFREGESWRLLTINKPTADDYVVCCQAFFRRRSTAESSSCSEATSESTSGA